MTDPLDRIADALELLALTTWLDSPGPDMVCDVLASRIEARLVAQQTPANAPLVQPGDDSRFSPLAPTGGDSGHLSPPPDDDPEWRDVPAEYREWRTVRCGDRHWTGTRWNTSDLDGCPGFPGLYWVKRHDHPARKPAPVASELQTEDVLGSELRVGDVVIGGYYESGFVRWEGPTEISLRRHGLTQTRTYRVRLPRPAAEPSASGAGIARANRLCVTVSHAAGSYTWTAHSEGEAHTIAGSINAAHAHATRELRERCERAERELVSATNALTHERVLARAQNERCERAECERDVWSGRACIEEQEAGNGRCGACRACMPAVISDLNARLSGQVAESYLLRRERDAAIARAEAAERVVEAVKAHRSRPTVTSQCALRDAEDAYDRARKDGAK